MGNAAYRKNISMNRIRNIRHLDSTFVRDRCVKYAGISGYQKWSGYPDSPVNSAEFPFQCVTRYSGSVGLYVSETQIWHRDQLDCMLGDLNYTGVSYLLVNGAWVFDKDSGAHFMSDDHSDNNVYESNCDIYELIGNWVYDVNNIVYYKTTTEAQDAGKHFVGRVNL